MLLLFAGSQSSPAPRNTAAHSCLANKEQLSSREAGLTFQRSPPAANAATAPRHHPPTPAQAEPTPHWAAPFTCQELGLPQGVNGAKNTHCLWSQRPGCAVPILLPPGCVTLANHFTSLSLTFLGCKVETIMPLPRLP